MIEFLTSFNVIEGYDSYKEPLCYSKNVCTVERSISRKLLIESEMLKVSNIQSTIPENSRKPLLALAFEFKIGTLGFFGVLGRIYIYIYCKTV